MWLRKHDLTGASSVGPHEWTPGADVTEVPDELGRDLLNLGGYSVAEPPEPEAAPVPGVTAPVSKRGRGGS